MPELPDIELYKRYLEAHALHKKLAQVEVLEKKTIRHGSEKELQKAMVHDSFETAERFGKWLLVHTKKGKCLAMHFGMTGALEYLEDGKLPASVRVIFEFEDHEKLVFADRRKLGGIELVKDREELIQRHELGPDAMEISWNAFSEALKGKKGKIKAALMDQRTVSGIGNVYADEILFQSRIHPESSVAHFDTPVLKALYKSVKPVLKTAIEYKGVREDLPDDYIIPQRREGGRCPHCKGKVTMTEVGGRTTYFCASCQVKY